MKLRDLLHEMQLVQEKIQVPPAKICGGTSRDKFMGRLENIADLDITNGTKSIDYLSQEFAIQLRKRYNITRKTMPDGHSTIFVGTLKMDFSSNFIVPNIDEHLSKRGIATPTDLQREMFSRDFTCNALLMDLDLKKIHDPTGQGFKDIKSRLIKTCLDPSITLTTNRNRVIRAIYLACKLDFNIDASIISYVKEHPQTVKISTEKSLAEKLNEAFTRDAKKAAYLLTIMGLWNLVPITEPMYPHYHTFLKGKASQ